MLLVDILIVGPDMNDPRAQTLGQDVAQPSACQGMPPGPTITAGKRLEEGFCEVTVVEADLFRSPAMLLRHGLTAEIARRWL
jgi:hypothetical protein